MARPVSSVKSAVPVKKASPAAAAKKAGKPVSFSISAEEGAKVYVVGSFNGWNPKKHQLSFRNGVHTVTVTVPAGRHEYKYLVNDCWCHDPSAQETVMNEFGTLNSVIVID
jgi:1,4-alpha-glucan branching enzyme